MLDIAAIILTKDEEIHIERCLRSVAAVCREVWVVDSYSTDATCDIARRMGAHVVQHPFTNQAAQFNWAIDTLPIEAAWLWRVDADEVIEPALSAIAERELPRLDDDVTGVYVNKKIVFMGRALMHGGWYPAQQIKLVRRGHGRSENKMMDEHLVVTDGTTASWDGDQTDINLKPLAWWWQKHVGYAKREAVNMLLMAYGMDDDSRGGEVEARLLGNGAERKRWVKRVYARCPLYVRPVVYFLGRYVMLGGFLDGRAGWVWHTRQGLKYRWLVDRNIARLRREHPTEAEMRTFLEGYL